MRCSHEAGCEIKAIAYMYKFQYCEIEKLEDDACKCPRRAVGNSCVMAESKISQDFGAWREISVEDFEFNPQQRLYDIQVTTDRDLFGVYTNKTFRNARWARWVCYEGPDEDEVKFELEDCGPWESNI